MVRYISEKKGAWLAGGGRGQEVTEASSANSQLLFASLILLASSNTLMVLAPFTISMWAASRLLKYTAEWRGVNPLIWELVIQHHDGSSQPGQPGIISSGVWGSYDRPWNAAPSTTHLIHNMHMSPFCSHSVDRWCRTHRRPLPGALAGGCGDSGRDLPGPRGATRCPRDAAQCGQGAGKGATWYCCYMHTSRSTKPIDDEENWTYICHVQV